MAEDVRVGNARVGTHSTRQRAGIPTTCEVCYFLAAPIFLSARQSKLTRTFLISDSFDSRHDRGRYHRTLDHLRDHPLLLLRRSQERRSGETSQEPSLLFELRPERLRRRFPAASDEPERLLRASSGSSPSGHDEQPSPTIEVPISRELSHLTPLLDFRTDENRSSRRTLECCRKKNYKIVYCLYFASPVSGSSPSFCLGCLHSRMDIPLVQPFCSIQPLPVFLASPKSLRCHSFCKGPGFPLLFVSVVLASSTVFTCSSRRSRAQRRSFVGRGLLLSREIRRLGYSSLSRESVRTSTRSGP